MIIVLCYTTSSCLYSVGQLNMSESSINHYGSNIEQPELGGSWTPGSCGARHRVAIIIPYRDREFHLKILLNHLHAILQVISETN